MQHEAYAHVDSHRHEHLLGRNAPVVQYIEDKCDENAQFEGSEKWRQNARMHVASED